jgi:hypothetical protein
VAAARRLLARFFSNFSTASRLNRLTDINEAFR